VPVQVAVVSALEVPVDLRRDESGEELLGQRVVRGEALAPQVVLVHAHDLEADRGREQLMRDLVMRPPAAVDQVVGVGGRVPLEESHEPELTDKLAGRTPHVRGVRPKADRLGYRPRRPRQPMDRSKARAIIR
jgi:hypothetical protein